MNVETRGEQSQTGQGVGRRWILMYVNKTPYPLNKGTHLRIWEMAQYLRGEYQVGMVMPRFSRHVSALSQGMDGVWVGGDYRGVWGRVRKHVWGPISKWRLGRLYREHLQDFSSNPLSSPHPQSALVLDRLCQQLELAAIICHKVQTAVPAVAIGKRHSVPVLLDVHDVLAIRSNRAQGVGVDLLEKDVQFSQVTLEDELSILRLFDALIAIQSEEGAFLQRHLPDKPIVVAPHPPRVKAPPRPVPGDGARPPVLLFVGSNASHNVDALQYFLAQQFPLVQERFPEVRLHVCGSVCEHVRSSLPQVEYFGVQDDLQPFYDSATLVVNPARFGSGLMIKTTDALAQSKCLVTTPVGAEGVLPMAREAFACASPDQLCATIVGLLENPERIRRFELAAYAFASEHLTPEACFLDLRRLLREITIQ